MRVDATPTVALGTLEFNVSGLTGTVTNATLRVFATQAPDPRLTSSPSLTPAGSRAAPAASPSTTPPRWPQRRQAPPAPSRRTWTTVNGTPLVAGNGTISLASQDCSPLCRCRVARAPIRRSWSSTPSVTRTPLRRRRRRGGRRLRTVRTRSMSAGRRRPIRGGGRLSRVP